VTPRSINALTIGGSSTTGAAGVEADLKTFTAFGVHASVVVTAIASQNTKGVQKIFYLPEEVVSQQIDSVFSDMQIKAIKIGMLGNERIAQAVLDGLRRWRGGNIVLDTVMTAQSDGSWLIHKESIKEMKRLIGLSTIVVPNTFEAEKLAGVRIKNVNDAKRAAKILKALGAEAVVIKGIEEDDGISDLMLHKNFRIFKKEMIGTGTHGGGCCFSSALAACLAKGLGIENALEETERFMEHAVENSIRIGSGIEAVDPTASLIINAERYAVIEDIRTALKELEGCNKFSSLIPEVGTNVVYALYNAREVDEVAGVVGRIRNAMGRPKSLGEIEFGASSHLARAVLKMMEFDSSKRAAINIRLTDANLAGCRKMGLRVSHYDRKEESEDIKRREGATIPWGIENAVRKARGIVDVVYQSGEVGREPSLIIFGRDARSVVRLALKLVLPKG